MIFMRASPALRATQQDQIPIMLRRHLLADHAPCILRVQFFYIAETHLLESSSIRLSLKSNILSVDQVGGSVF
jgi:hypothetical protein